MPTDKTEPKLSHKTLDAIKMVNAGVDPQTALNYVNLKDNIRPETVSRFKANVKKYSMLQPSIVKNARSQIKRILEGEVRELPQQTVNKNGEVVHYTQTVAPSDTNILAAVSMVYDRYEPAIKQTANLNLNIDCNPVDLSQWSNRQVDGKEQKVIDVECQETVQNDSGT